MDVLNAQDGRGIARDFAKEGSYAAKAIVDITEQVLGYHSLRQSLLTIAKSFLKDDPKLEAAGSRGQGPVQAFFQELGNFLPLRTDVVCQQHEISASP